MSRLTSLIDLASYTRGVEAEFVKDLSAAERDASGSFEDWAAKDLVAHVTTWRERGVAELEAARGGRMEPEADEFEEANQAIYQKNRHLPWEVILRRGETSWTALTKSLKDLPEDLLALTAAGQPTRPLWRRITVDAGNHPVLHYSEFSRRRGRPVPATRWMEGLTPLLLAVDPSGEWHGVVHYNLACHYAQSGMTDSALESLARSLGRNPGLREWSTKDVDLVPIRSDPRFASITGPQAHPG